MPGLIMSGRQGTVAFFIFFVFAALAVGGLSWTLWNMSSPTGEYAQTRVNYIPPSFWAATPEGVVVPPHRQAYQCKCVAPKETGYCGIANCLNQETAHAFCVASLPAGAVCEKCIPKGTLQKATSSVHVIATATCTV